MRGKALIVDDVDLNRAMLCQIFESDYEVLEAENGEEALKLIEQYTDEITVVLLDLIMPVLDGYGVLEELKQRTLLSRFPILVVSSDNYLENEVKCFEYGVSDFIRKPYYANVVKQRVNNIVELYQYKNELEEKLEKKEALVKRQNQFLKQQAEKLKKNNAEIIDILGTVVENRNLESGEHIKRVKGFSLILAEKIMKIYPEYGLTKERVEMISAASALHDIGKIAIPDNILLKPGKLTDEEFGVMKTHSLRGCEILSDIQGTWDAEYGKLSYEICRYHHERYDGKGYPDGLVGDDIPISAQIVSLADVYDALVSKRVYKDAFSKEEAFKMIMAGECGMFSPKLLKCLEEGKAEFEELAERYQEADLKKEMEEKNS